MGGAIEAEAAAGGPDNRANDQADPGQSRLQECDEDGDGGGDTRGNLNTLATPHSKSIMPVTSKISIHNHRPSSVKNTESRIQATRLIAPSHPLPEIAVHPSGQSMETSLPIAPVGLYLYSHVTHKSTHLTSDMLLVFENLPTLISCVRRATALRFTPRSLIILTICQPHGGLLS